MRKILISVIVCLMFIGTVTLMVKGATAVNLNGFIGLKEENKNVDEKINELSNVISVTFPNAESNLESTASKLTNSKAEYENQAALSSLNESSYASQFEKYEIDFLWTKLGNYAKEENVVIKIDVTTNQTTSTLYDLNFSVTGGYVNITDFIYDIENDSRLGFKIDDFKMQMSNGVLLGTFSCKEISLNVGTLENKDADKGATSDTDEEKTNSKNTNTTKKSNTNKNTNSTSNTSKKSTDTANDETTDDESIVTDEND